MKCLLISFTYFGDPFFPPSLFALNLQCGCFFGRARLLFCQGHAREEWEPDVKWATLSAALAVSGI